MHAMTTNNAPCRCLKAAVVSLMSLQVLASWGSSDVDTTIYGNKLSRDWLYDATAMSVKLEGCMYGYVDDNEEAACMENESEDGTSYWYMMANCRRAQAVYSVYATSSGSSASCNGGNFKETFVTTTGASEFITTLQQYDQNGNFNANGDDVEEAFDGELPTCEQANGYYIGLGCSDDGTFNLQYYDDQYCMKPSGQTYNKLKALNKALKAYKSCEGIGAGSGDDGGNSGDNLAEALIYYSNSCTSLDSSLCSDSSSMESRRKHTGSRMRHSGFGAGKTWMTKLKYVAGGLLLLSSFVMFTGILFTNRRRRRALMQRKYRQRKGEDRSRRSKSRSKSKVRSSSSRKSRSKSKSRSKREDGDEQNAGVFT